MLPWASWPQLRGCSCLPSPTGAKQQACWAVSWRPPRADTCHPGPARALPGASLLTQQLQGQCAALLMAVPSTELWRTTPAQPKPWRHSFHQSRPLLPARWGSMQGSHGGGDTGASKAPSAQTADPQELSRGGPEWQPGSKAERKRNKKKAVQAARAGLATCQGSATAQGSSGGRAAAAQDVGDPEAGADGLTGGFWAGWQPAGAALPILHMRPTGSTAEPTAADSEDLEGIPQGSWRARREKDDGNTGLWTSGHVKASGSASESSKPAAPRLLMEDRECVMCLSEPPMTWLAPCGHQALCLGCTEQLFGRAGQPHVAGRCPVCRLPVLSYIAALFTT